MTTALATAADVSPAPGQLTAEQVEIIKGTICRDASNEELKLFLAVCERTRLDPISKQIHATFRNDRKAGRKVMTIQVGIDGFRVIAARTGELDGQDGPYWCGTDGVWREVWLNPNQPPAAAMVKVYRKGCRFPFVGVATFKSYAQKWPDGSPSGLWGTMPDNQLAKCAEALGLRKAFPNDLSGLYTDDEMGQADNPEPRQVDAKPTTSPPPPALPPPPPAVAAELITEGEPITDGRAANALAKRAGWTWPQLVQSMNTKFGATYSPTQTKWLDVKREHREETVSALQQVAARKEAEEAAKADRLKAEQRAAADALAAQQIDTPDSVFALLEQLAKLHNCTTARFIPQMAAVCDGESYTDNMTPDQLKRAAAWARAELKKGGGK